MADADTGMRRTMWRLTSQAKTAAVRTFMRGPRVGSWPTIMGLMSTKHTVISPR